MNSKKDFNRLVPKLFWTRPKCEFGEHLAIRASNNVWKNTVMWMIFGSKLLCSFLCQQSTLFSSIYARGVKHTARGPKPARCEVESGPRDDFVK